MWHISRLDNSGDVSQIRFGVRFLDTTRTETETDDSALSPPHSARTPPPRQITPHLSPHHLPVLGTSKGLRGVVDLVLGLRPAPSLGILFSIFDISQSQSIKRIVHRVDLFTDSKQASTMINPRRNSTGTTVPTAASSSVVIASGAPAVAAASSSSTPVRRASRATAAAPTTTGNAEVTPLMLTTPSNTVESWPLEGILDPRTIGDDDSDDDSDDPTAHRRGRLHRFRRHVLAFYEKFDFPIHVLTVILIAWLYPPLGAVYVAPYVTANWVAVIYIFVMFGLGVRTEEFASALSKMRFNALIQVYNLGFMSATIYGVTRLLAMSGILTQTLADGLAICGCLPMSINVGIILTMAAGGDEAVAIFNTSFGNFIGVFLSPALILGYLGTAGYVNVGQIYMKLTLIVIVPLIVGQAIQRLVRPVREFYFAHKKAFKKSAEWALVFIIFTIFSRNFYSGAKVPLGQVFILIACVICCILGFMGITWLMLRLLYKDTPILRVTGTFISIQKTSTYPCCCCCCCCCHLRREPVSHQAEPPSSSFSFFVAVALGVPLITSIYGKDPNLAFYTLPVMCWHPLQLILGSILVPHMVRFLAREKGRMAAEGAEGSAGSDEEEPPASDEESATDGDVEVRGKTLVTSDSQGAAVGKAGAVGAAKASKAKPTTTKAVAVAVGDEEEDSTTGLQ
jgi:solute carrier family 10 (sodium/bile acid cotransporter), member 7